MTSISAITSGTTSVAHRMPPPRNQGQDPMAAVAEKLGLSSDDLKAGLPAEATDADEDKLSRLSDLLDMDADEVQSQAGSATDLVRLLQSKGVDLAALRDVLSSGDLLDVAA
jgi:hypothetical protein